MDDLRFGAAIRALRVRRRLRQIDLGRLAGVSASAVSRIERGRLDAVTIETIRRVAKSLDVRVDLMARWRAGELDRLLNARHSAMHEVLARLFDDLPDWVAAPEVTFAVFGERGVIDILAFHAGRRALLVIEIKTDIVDVQDLVGSLDRKRRLAPGVARERGWGLPLSTSVWVVVEDARANRRRVAAHRSMLRRAFPSDGRVLRGWLRSPGEPIWALSFLPISRRGTGMRELPPRQRVRRPQPSVGERRRSA